MANFIEQSINTYSGLSTETKPTQAAGNVIPNGSRWREVDTEKNFFYNLSDDTWYEVGLIVSSSVVVNVTNAIETLAYDLNAAAYSETTAITKDYIFDNIELNFSTNEAKTITITSALGTILWGGDVDTSSDNLGYNTTSQHFNLIFNQGFDANDNITVEVTQLTGAGTMNCVLKIR